MSALSARPLPALASTVAESEETWTWLKELERFLSVAEAPNAGEVTNNVGSSDVVDAIGDVKTPRVHGAWDVAEMPGKVQALSSVAGVTPPLVRHPIARGFAHSRTNEYDENDAFATDMRENGLRVPIDGPPPAGSPVAIEYGDGYEF